MQIRLRRRSWTSHPRSARCWGCPIPANSQGRVLWEALDVPAEHDADLKQLEQEQRTALQAHMPDRNRVSKGAAIRAPAIGDLDWLLSGGGSLRLHLRTAPVRNGSPRLLRLLRSCIFRTVSMRSVSGIRSARSCARSICTLSWPRMRGQRQTAFGISAVVLFRLVGRRSGAAIRLATLIGSVAALLVAWTHFEHGLTMDRWMVALGPVFQAYLHMVAIVGVVLGIFLVVVLNRLIPGTRESAQ